ncbi:hypothetical protein JYG40_15455, partial [Escherichia fergusonii]|nr:hypothetical protein [Escherichia fergusonii]
MEYPADKKLERLVCSSFQELRKFTEILQLPPDKYCLLYTSPRIRGFVISAKLLSVVACGYAFQ